MTFLPKDGWRVSNFKDSHIVAFMYTNIAYAVSHMDVKLNKNLKLSSIACYFLLRIYFAFN